jgi:hypothetical protein
VHGIVFLGAVGLFSSVLSGSYVLESSDEDICPRVFGKYYFLEHSLLLLCHFFLCYSCLCFICCFFTWQVKSRPLAKTLNKTSVVSGEIMGRTILLTLGRSKVEWDRTNCGIFLYWHGRLIEVRLAVLA